MEVENTVDKDELRRIRQRAADFRFRQRHLKKCREKDKRRYYENKESEIARNAKYHRDNKEKVNQRVRNRRHRITQEQFDAIFLKQNGCCALCYTPFGTDTPHLDHNHRCCPKLRSCDKCRRELLCKDCNLGLGRFKDNITVLENAIQYLKRHDNVTQPNISRESLAASS